MFVDSQTRSGHSSNCTARVHRNASRTLRNRSRRRQRQPRLASSTHTLAGQGPCHRKPTSSGASISTAGLCRKLGSWPETGSRRASTRGGCHVRDCRGAVRSARLPQSVRVRQRHQEEEDTGTRDLERQSRSACRGPSLHLLASRRHRINSNCRVSLCARPRPCHRRNRSPRRSSTVDMDRGTRAARPCPTFASRSRLSRARTVPCPRVSTRPCRPSRPPPPRRRQEQERSRPLRVRHSLHLLHLLLRKPPR